MKGMLKGMRIVTIVAVLLSLGLAVLYPAPANALSGSSFNPANIIDDGVFFNNNTMSIDTIQAFLNSKVPTCDTNGTQPSTHSGYATRADWGRANGAAPPYTCLKDYSQNVPAVSPDSFCGGMTGGTKSAAIIIYDVARVCGINPQVLIVLLQKEQSLVTDDWPWPIQYRSATGFGCPDTAPCDAEFYGFFNQVYRAARQFKRYIQQSDVFNYAAGRTSFISYQANNPGCGGTNVTIQNSATAALYNYTPYQPNAAALANLYGTGDGCSAYGNRNFWRMFNDWFGSTRSTSLVRTVENPQVYLIAYDKKYPIYNEGLLYDLTRPFGQVSFTSQSYLNTLQTASALKRLVKSQSSPDLYFFDAGFKLKFGSCELASDYGTDCGQEAVLNDYQIAALRTGPPMSSFFQTTSGFKYYITNGSRKEIYDEASRQNAGLSGYYNVLEADAIENLTIGSPVIRSNVIVRGYYTAKYYYYRNYLFTPIASDLVASPFVGGMTHGSLTEDTIWRSTIGTEFKGFLADSSGNKYVIDSSGKKQLSSSSEWTSSFSTAFDDAVISQAKNSTQGTDRRFIKQTNSPTIYYVAGSKKYPIYDWTYFTKLNGNSSAYGTIYPSTAGVIANGSGILRTNTVVKTPDSPNVYYIDGLFRRWYVGNLEATKDLGAGSTVYTVSAGALNQNTQVGNVSNLVSCDGTKYAAVYTGLYKVGNETQSEFGWTDGQFNTLNGVNCQYLLKLTSELSRFIKTRDGKIYKVTGGQKRHIQSMNTFYQQGGTPQAVLDVSNSFASLITTGSPL